MEKNKIIITKEEIAQQAQFMEQVCAWNRTYFLQTGMRRKANIQTYGCQQNEADSERLSGMAVEMGYDLTDLPAESDLILVNTCAVREHAELKALSITGQFKHLKAKKPELLIGLCGCMVSQEHRKDDVKMKYSYVDFSFGTSMLYRFPEILFRAIQQEKRFFYLDESEGNIAEGLPILRSNSIKAWVSIMYGCNNFCTYCVVPYVRGRERSRAKEDILQEIEELTKQGYKEITLLGQNVNSYGKDLGLPCDFSDLLEEICQISGDFWIRFMTSHPKDASKKLMDTIARNPKIAKQFHLPLQAGNNRILEAMNRHYTRESYLDLVRYMREKMPDIALSTDIIVGFPTETEEEFEDTLTLLQEVKFDSIYSFLYSKREGTPAAKMEGQVPQAIQSERFERLLATQNRISRNKNVQNYENKVVCILVEGKSKNDDTMYAGRTETNKIVHFAATDSAIGTFAKVKITRAETFALFGELV